MTYKIKIDNNSDGSLPEVAKINTKMKPIAIKDSNSEIERGELILDPETGALHKALGKPHSKGGTPVNLKDSSFVFSNFKDLAFNKKEKELFEFKKGGTKAKLNTPSKILEKEVDLEHHNKMIKFLQDEKNQTSPTLNSAKLMMLKNLEKAGQVAFLQESKKGVPAPDFAMNTAPIYSADTDEDITQSKQYMQAGGTKYKLKDGQKYTAEELKSIFGWTDEDIKKNATNGVATAINSKPTPKAWETWKGDKLKNFETKFGVTNAAVVGPTMEEYAQKLGYPATAPKDIKSFQDWMYNNKEHPEWKQIIDARHTQYGQPNAGTPVDGKFGRRWMESLADITTTTQKPSKVIGSPAEPVRTTGVAPMTVVPRKEAPQVGNNAGNPDGIVDPTTYNTALTPWQKINALIPLYRAATVKTQYPIRQHQESVIPQFENISAQPQLDESNRGYFNAAALTKSMNPTQASSFIQQLAGNRIDANQRVLGNVQNQNVQTQNRQKETTANILNQDAAANRQFDLRFYDQTKMAEKNAGDLKEAYEQQAVNNFNDTIEKKLAFDSFLNSQQQYKGKKTYIDADGVQHYQGVAPYSPKANFFGQTVKYNQPNIDFTKPSGQGLNTDPLQKMLEEIDNSGADENTKIKSKTLLLNSYLKQNKKMGGTHRPTKRSKNTSY